MKIDFMLPFIIHMFISQNTERKTARTLHHDIVSVKKMLCRPNQLQTKSDLNKIYPQKWHQIDTHYASSLASTEKQCRNICKKSQKMQKYQSRLSEADLGEICYQRFKGKSNNLWEMKENPAEEGKHLNKKSSIQFDSRFESGNLSEVFVKDTGDQKFYSLLLQNDTNTFGYTQWFYFRVKCEELYQNVRFQIINMQKSTSLFQKGMKIAVFSQQKQTLNKIGWHRDGNNIEYGLNGLIDAHGNKLSTLLFQYRFDSSEWVYFAYSYPYTYTQLKKYLKNTELAKNLIRVKSIGLTALKNDVFMVEEKSKVKQVDESKEYLLVMARVHPGETVSSFIVKGFIDAFVSDLPQAKYLKSKFQVKIIPMQNPDGVIHGNTRTSFVGQDLNRRWAAPSSVLHPEIHAIKQYVSNLERKGCKVFAMLDLHAHTKKQSSFLYGCCTKNHSQNYREVRMLNNIFGMCDANFKKDYSSFFVSEDKKSTARVSFYYSSSIFSYTLQASFMSAKDNLLHFSLQDYEKLGKNALKSFAYLKQSINPTQTLLSELQLNIPKINEESFEQFFDEGKGSDDESCSNPSQCNFNEQYLKRDILNLKEDIFMKQKTRYRTNKKDLSFGSPRKFDLSMKKRSKFFQTDKLPKRSEREQFPSLKNFEKKQQGIYNFFNFKPRKYGQKRYCFDKTIT